MSSWYSGYIKCPYCRKETEFSYHIDMNVKDRCQHCNKVFKIVMDFVGIKMNSKRLIK